MEKVCVTGGAGFIGSNLVNRLIQEGYDVDIVDDMSAGVKEFINPGVNKAYFMDFSDERFLSVVKAQTYDCVFHLAAKPRVSYSVEYPSETTDINVNRTVKLLEACRGNVRRFVNTSSSSVYGGARQRPTKETTKHNPRSPYALQKSATELYCKLFSDLYDMDIVSVRPFNVFGPNQLGNNAYCTAVSAWLYAVKHGKPLRSDGDGTQSRDMTYVDNVVDVFVRCAQYSKKFSGDAFNAGTECCVSNNEILGWFTAEYPNCTIVHAPPRVGDVKITQASMEKAQTVLGWKRLVSFWDGLNLARQWAMSSDLF